MINRIVKVLFSLSLILLGGILVHPLVTLRSVAAQASAAAPKDNQELLSLYQEDQSDRNPPAGGSIDWKIVARRDFLRLTVVKELYAQKKLQTGPDYYHAAMILQHSGTAEDYLLSHELCIVAICKGNEEAKWLAAASEDRFLMSIGRGQRFGTQYTRKGPNATYLIYRIEPGVTDELRRALNVKPIAGREGEMDRK
jgi:hypothetical protein